MYITEDHNNSDESFDWAQYFSRIDTRTDDTPFACRRSFQNIRKHLKEDGVRMGFVLAKLIRAIFRNAVWPDEPKVLELGAGTGFLTRCLISQFQGSGVLVDRNENSFKAYCSRVQPGAMAIQYRVEDIFTLQMPERFDIVCSFGLIEHFKDKKSVLEVHKKFIREHGHALILVPLDSILTRVFFAAHPELNLGYRELLTLRELERILFAEQLEVTDMQVSAGYVYDFAAALCRLRQPECGSGSLSDR